MDHPVGVAGVHAPAFVERSRGVSAHRRRRAVSPGFTPRPSLSVGLRGAGGGQSAGVAGVHAPAFVERRCPRWCGAGAGSCVAGVHAPAFVERAPTAAGSPSRRSVAGVHAPAFVERCRGRGQSTPRPRVSPGFPRPSLSVGGRGRAGALPVVSPGFTPRPSLSERLSRFVIPPGDPGVAGVHAPAFVERR